MTQASVDRPSNDEDRPLPKLDWFLLPALSLLAIVVVVFSVEGAARLLYSESNTKTLSCLVLNDSTTGVRAIPNTECSEKIPEGELAKYTFNSCGHRAGVECGPKAADTYRIVLIGSSFNFGMWVARERSFAALLQDELSRRTGRKVELYNESMEWGTPRSVDLRFNEVLAAKPDMILWPITPHEIEHVDLTVPEGGPQDADGGPADPASVHASKSRSNFFRTAFDNVLSRLYRLIGFKPGSIYGFKPRSILMLRHLLFQSQSQYVKQYLSQSDTTEYLRTENTVGWRLLLAHFARYYTDVQAKANSVGAIVVVSTLPERAQAAMISMKEWPAGFDPYKFGDDLRAIVIREGGTYVDILAGFRDIPNPEQGYFPVDGHPDGRGHATISRLLADALTGGTVPVLSGVAQLRTNTVQER
jgi:hypothetical protein